MREIADGVGAVPTREDVVEQLERLVNSPVLHGAESLCRLLRFLTIRSLDQRGETIKERDIASELLGRSEDFDPRLDPTIRVQAGRLRSKVIEYYATVARPEELVLEIPKGAYAVTVRVPESIAEQTQPDYGGLIARVRQRIGRKWPRVSQALVAGLLLVAIISTLAVWKYRTPAVHSPSALRTFWSDFFGRSQGPLIVFSNHGGSGNPELANDSFTGVGEVFATQNLSRLCGSFHTAPVLKRASTMDWDDARDRNVIFLGSPEANQAVLELPLDQEFAFRTSAGPPARLIIVNRHPRDGEAQSYSADTNSSEYEDYGVITYMPGPAEHQFIVLAAGISTWSTQAAVEFLCQEGSIRQVLSRLRAGKPSPFSAVIAVNVRKGVPVRSRLVALHPMRG